MLGCVEGIVNNVSGRGKVFPVSSMLCTIASTTTKPATLVVKQLFQIALKRNDFLQEAETDRTSSQPRRTQVPKNAAIVNIRVTKQLLMMLLDVARIAGSVACSGPV